MKQYRIYFIKDGVKLTKLIEAKSVYDVINMYKNIEIIIIKEIDNLENFQFAN